MRISQRGQITIPKALRERFGMDHDVEVEVTPTPGGLLIRKRDDGRPVMHTVTDREASSGGMGEHSMDGINGTHHKDAEDRPEGETMGERVHRILDERTGMHPVDRVSGILGKDALGKGVSVDEYIEEIRGR